MRCRKHLSCKLPYHKITEIRLENANNLILIITVKALNSISQISLGPQIFFLFEKHYFMTCFGLQQSFYYFYVEIEFFFVVILNDKTKHAKKLFNKKKKPFFIPLTQTFFLGTSTLLTYSCSELSKTNHFRSKQNLVIP